MTKVLVVEEKHGTYYYPASSEEELAKSCLSILKRRFEDGYWYLSPDEMFSQSIIELIPDFNEVEDKNQAIEIFRKTVIEPILDPEAQALVRNKLNKAIRHYKERKSYEKWYNEMKKAVEDEEFGLGVIKYKSGRTEPRAFYLLDYRSDYEYEHVELEPLQEVN